MKALAILAAAIALSACTYAPMPQGDISYRLQRANAMWQVYGEPRPVHQPAYFPPLTYVQPPMAPMTCQRFGPRVVCQ